jgi:DNA-binding NarL/FixJ family response regulator
MDYAPPGAPQKGAGRCQVQPMPIDVAIVEDDAAPRERYADLIASAADMRLLWAAQTAAEALRLLESTPPHVLLVDLGLPDSSGLQVIARAKLRRPDCEVMVVSVFGDEEHVVAAIAAGASGYVLKDALAASFLGTIRELRAGGSPISPSIARIILNRTRAPGATPQAGAASDCDLAEREGEILSLVAKGFNFQEIARLLDISNNTVKTHIYRIYRKLSVHSRGEAVFEAKRLGLLDF